jgi:hypothetical protein
MSAVATEGMEVITLKPTNSMKQGAGQEILQSTTACH